MGNDLKTAAGYIATTGTLVAAGVTFGQVKWINKAVEDWAEFTAENAKKSIIGNAAGAVGWAAATAGGALATAATFGQWDAAKDFTADAARGTWDCTSNMTVQAINTTIGIADSTISAPGIGHVIGGTQYVISKITDDDDLEEKGKQRMNRANRSTWVVTGAIVGLSVGPAGAIAGAITGGAAFDGLDTTYSSINHGKFTPKGHIKSVSDIANADTGKDVVSGLVDIALSTTMDGVAGYAVHWASTKLSKESGGLSQSKNENLKEYNNQEYSDNNIGIDESIPTEDLNSDAQLNKIRMQMRRDFQLKNLNNNESSGVTTVIRWGSAAVAGTLAYGHIKLIESKRRNKD